MIGGMPNIEKVLASNLKRLMKARGWSARELSRRSKGEISDRYVGMLRQGQSSATLNIIEVLAEALEVDPWQLLVPNLDPLPERAQRLSALVEHYNATPDDGRFHIERVAERESEYVNPK